MKPSPALIVATLALVVALGGTAVAAVGPAGIANGAVTTPKLRNGAVTTPKVARNAVVTAHLRNGSVTAAKLAPNSVATPMVRNGAITAAKIRNGSVGWNKLAPDARGRIEAAYEVYATAYIEEGGAGASVVAARSYNSLAAGAITATRTEVGVYEVAIPGLSTQLGQLTNVLVSLETEDADVAGATVSRAGNVLTVRVRNFNGDPVNLSIDDGISIGLI